jgi:hypothetical protein
MPFGDKVIEGLLFPGASRTFGRMMLKEKFDLSP